MLKQHNNSITGLSIGSLPTGFADDADAVNKQWLGVRKDKLSGIEREFHAWMENYESMIRHMIVGFEAKPSLQDELFQDIALNIWTAIPNFRQQSSSKTFVARITQNVLASHVAKAVKTVKSSSIEDIKCEEPGSDSTPYAELDQLQRQKLLQKAIQTLSFEQKQVITLALEGMSYKEISEILDISVANAGVRLQRAKQAITKILDT